MDIGVTPILARVKFHRFVISGDLGEGRENGKGAFGADFLVFAVGLSRAIPDLLWLFFE